ncbi:MAG TPA: hypothetical protein VJ850_08325 [Candidatus Limnocylindrales bacterium]|nr:hypothetical protein [Candidatus Limnocylindrales bacterium]
MPQPTGSTPFRDEPYFQGDGSKFQWKNCVLASCTDLIGRTTVGALRVPASRLRTITGDVDGGVSYSQAADAVHNATDGKVVLKVRLGLDRDQVRDIAVSGRGFCISIDCSVTFGTARATNEFKGFHTVYANDYKWRTGGVCHCERNLDQPGATYEDHGEYLVADPGIRAGYRWWSASLLYRAAEQRGGGHINTLVGADTEGVTRFGRMAGFVRGSASTDGPKLAAVVPNESYTVKATQNGGPWRRADTSIAFGWHRIEFDGGVAFAAGERLGE